MFKITFTTAIFFLLQLQATTQHLFRIVENDKIGYINEEGKMVISPVFYNGSEFFEGLAAARKGGYYGYIDVSGNFTIQPEFDRADHFDHGIAKVYKKGNCFFINKKGEQVIPNVYSELTFISDNKAVVETITGKAGLLELTTQRLIIDTIYSSIWNFTDGVAIAYKFPSKRKTRNEKKGLIDTSGRVVVPFGKYRDIQSFSNGLAMVEYRNEKLGGAVNTKGIEVFKRKYRGEYFLGNSFHDGFAKINLYKYWLPEEKNSSWSSDKSYEGYINTSGNIVLDDTSYAEIADFSSRRAFVKLDNFSYKMIDTKFNTIGETIFRSVANDGFEGNYAIVETAAGWGVIDTSGNFTVKPQYNEISRVGIIDDCFFFKDNNELMGMADLSNKIIIEPMMQQFDTRGFVNGLLKAVVDNRLTYINKQGQVVWQADEKNATALFKLNIDYMMRGYFYAYSAGRRTQGPFGGWAISSNEPQNINSSSFDSNALSIKIDTGQVDTFARKYYGYKLFIANTTTETVRFNAQDSRLYMTLQAQDENGEWMDIEYLPSSWCGNSYHQVELDPNKYWSFTIPVYEGVLATKIRAALKCIDKEDQESERFIYSNIIYGSINPGQFWHKKNYQPAGLMDPYTN
ncbi:MAG: WG repeat-containing protein [Ferruginibacter sp.]